MSPKTYTTKEAAAAIGVTRQTLQAWIAREKVAAPITEVRDGHAVRLWSPSHVARLRELKKQIYRKGGGRPRKKK